MPSEAVLPKPIPTTKAPTTAAPTTHICDTKGAELCEEICRKLPINFDEDYQCQCGPGRKPDSDGNCSEGKKIIEETFCETDEECEAEFENSECGVKSCECKMKHDLSSDGTECLPESQTLDKIKMFKMYRFIELWNNGESGDNKITIIRGDTTIENEEDSVIDPLYNLGDQLIKGQDL